MSSSMNREAVTIWTSVGDRVEEQLREQVRHSLGSEDWVDLWVNQLVANTELSEIGTEGSSSFRAKRLGRR